MGPVLFNLYGSTEAGLISLATPEDLRVAPASVGRTLPGVSVDLQASDGVSVGPGQIGRLRVRGELVQGQADTGEAVDTGDLAHFGEDGRLYLDGRADDMLICGGENVLPKTIEDVINRRPYVLASAAVGVPSVEYGQSVHLFVELRTGFGHVSQACYRGRCESVPSACLATSRHHNRGGAAARSLGEDPSSPVEGRLSPAKDDRLDIPAEFFCVVSSQCGEGDSNPHFLRNQILSLARLPVPPSPRRANAMVANSWR